jgi:hypothetical protein
MLHESDRSPVKLPIDEALSGAVLPQAEAGDFRRHAGLSAELVRPLLDIRVQDFLRISERILTQSLFTSFHNAFFSTRGPNVETSNETQESFATMYLGLFDRHVKIQGEAPNKDPIDLLGQQIVPFIDAVSEFTRDLRLELVRNVKALARELDEQSKASSDPQESADPDSAGGSLFSMLGASRQIDMMIAEASRSMDNIREQLEIFRYEPVYAGNECNLNELAASFRARGMEVALSDRDPIIMLPPHDLGLLVHDYVSEVYGYLVKMQGRTLEALLENAGGSAGDGEREAAVRWMARANPLTLQVEGYDAINLSLQIPALTQDASALERQLSDFIDRYRNFATSLGVEIEVSVERDDSLYCGNVRFTLPVTVARFEARSVGVGEESSASEDMDQEAGELGRFGARCGRFGPHELPTNPIVVIEDAFLANPILVDALNSATAPLTQLMTGALDFDAVRFHQQRHPFTGQEIPGIWVVFERKSPPEPSSIQLARAAVQESLQTLDSDHHMSMWQGPETGLVRGRLHDFADEDLMEVFFELSKQVGFRRFDLGSLKLPADQQKELLSQMRVLKDSHPNDDLILINDISLSLPAKGKSGSFFEVRTAQNEPVAFVTMEKKHGTVDVVRSDLQLFRSLAHRVSEAVELSGIHLATRQRDLDAFFTAQGLDLGTNVTSALLEVAKSWLPAVPPRLLMNGVLMHFVQRPDYELFSDAEAAHLIHRRERRK